MFNVDVVGVLIKDADIIKWRDKDFLIATVVITLARNEKIFVNVGSVLTKIIELKEQLKQGVVITIKGSIRPLRSFINKSDKIIQRMRISPKEIRICGESVEIDDQTEDLTIRNTMDNPWDDY